MEQIIKTTMSIVIILIFTVLGLHLISSNIAAHEAVSFKSDVIKQIENSNYNENVIEQCKQQAISQGYTLEVNVMKYDDDNKFTMAEVIVHYEYNIPILNINNLHQTSGYAR